MLESATRTPLSTDVGNPTDPGSVPSSGHDAIGMGLCLGAATISAVMLGADRDAKGAARRSSVHLIRHATYPHEGDPKQTVVKLLADFAPADDHRVAVTGRRLRRSVNLTSISEPEAVSHAYRYLKPQGIDCPAIVSAGGETFMVYVLDSAGNIANVITGNKCASGTGEFFIQQLRRMNVSLATVSQWSQNVSPYAVSGRCSVFCKSDCTHATNQGVSRTRVVAGLCRMMAEKILVLLKDIPRQNIMLVGGTALNQMMVAHLDQQIDNLIVPQEAPFFEALGAALWTLEHATRHYEGTEALFSRRAARFDRLPPLAGFRQRVTFKSMPGDTARAGDVCLLGLDVGSTTTKAVLLREADDAMLASVYLRTNGDPVGASRRCYAALLDQISAVTAPDTLRIIGLGVCGSGRQIAGLHADTDGVINEIIAHCTAAVYFDPDVDTLFEIGGQDAKYTHITAGVASDYAMNEACSAGTGSFLEESAQESLGIDVRQIADVALTATSPPNFNDQCAAFIASDIKNAMHEGIRRSDIVAGLVYSICMNYTNRVKGNRPTGRRIFMQGGVCYNQAVPMAMAALVGKPIVVPPEPGLMGAFGVALEVKKRLSSGLLKPAVFDLHRLINREATIVRHFTCRAGGRTCDRSCEIAIVCVDGKKIPFGGACNRYYNLRKRIRVDANALDLVGQRQAAVVRDYRPAEQPCGSTTRSSIGINRSFLFHAFFPLYATFFEHLGVDVRVPDRPSPQGIARQGAAFCYPAELSHGYFQDLLDDDDPPDFLFLPHVKAVPRCEDASTAMLCPFVQAEPYFLRTTFRRQMAASGFTANRVLMPVLDLSAGLSAAGPPLIRTARQMGLSEHRAAAAVDRALCVQERVRTRILHMGQRALQSLTDDPRRMAVVIFGRPYNAFADEAHMGIPRKLASRGHLVLPLDSLPLEGRQAKRHMYWGYGQRILQAARLVAAHPQLFGVYITNFSCGPDSFLIGYFRDIMGSKPSLTLELDSHTADAGLETRIEAFLDVVAAWRHLRPNRSAPTVGNGFRPAQTAMQRGVPGVRLASGTWLPMTDPRVTLLFPSMGQLSSEALAAAFSGAGVRSIAARPADESILKLGRANTTGKECLPLILTTGTLLHHQDQRPSDEVLVYFMATGAGPCRFGQYKVFMEDLIRKRALENIALFSLDSETGYHGLDRRLHRQGWQSMVIADAMEDIRAMLLANAVNSQRAMVVFDKVWQELTEAMASRQAGAVDRQLERSAARLGKVALKRPADTVPVVTLVGEIFVRRDDISRQFITERLARMGFATCCAPVSEWLHYADWLLARKLAANGHGTLWQRLGLKLKQRSMHQTEDRIRRVLARSGLIGTHGVDIPGIIAHARPFLAPDHHGEAILTIGSALSDIASQSCGVIAIGPFGCMPNRIAESILGEVMTTADKLRCPQAGHRLHECLAGMDKLPFLAIESDGSPFPQVIEAKLEAFCLRARHLHRRMQHAKKRCLP